jgi:hypothetical protein
MSPEDRAASQPTHPSVSAREQPVETLQLEHLAGIKRERALKTLVAASVQIMSVIGSRLHNTHVARG